MRNILFVVLISFLVCNYSSADIIDLLGSRDWKTREATSEKLLRGSPKNYIKVLRGLKHDDIEIRMRCKVLASAMAEKVPFEFFIKHPQYWKYKIQWIESLIQVHKPTELKALNTFVKHTSVDVYGPVLVSIYRRTTDYGKILMQELMSKAAIASLHDGEEPDGDDNPYIEILLRRLFNRGGSNEIRCIMALGAIKKYVVYRELIERAMSINEHSNLYINYKGFWHSKDKLLQSAYADIIHGFPVKYKRQFILEHKKKGVDITKRVEKVYKILPTKSIKLIFKEILEKAKQEAD